jgi:putative tricarboxylic transport membrane protein
MLNRTSIIGIFLMFLSALFFAGTWSFFDDGGYVSPRVFPRIISGCMFLLATIMVAQSLFEHRNSVQEETQQDTVIGTGAGRQTWWRIAGAVLVSFAYTQVIEHLGYLVSTALFLATMILLFNEKRWYIVATVSIVGTTVFYTVFRIIFKVPLPRFDLF